MCNLKKFLTPITNLFGGGGGDDGSSALAAEQALERQRQAEREATQRAAIGDIDAQFAQFDDPFYDSRRKMVSESLMPDLEKQASEAKRQITLGLAQKGQLQGSRAAKKYAELNEAIAGGRTAVDQKADQAASRLRTAVAAERGRLYDAARGSPDPRGTAAALSADVGRQFNDASALDFDALGPLFQNLTASVSNLNSAATYDARRRMADAYAKSAIGGSGKEFVYG